MLRKKSPSHTSRFHTTTAAMKTEQAARAHDVPGRLIPVPREITAGCGLAWSAPTEAEEALRALLSDIGVIAQDFHHLTI